MADDWIGRILALVQNAGVALLRADRDGKCLPARGSAMSSAATVGETLSPKSFAQVCDMFWRESGIRIARHKISFVASRLQPRLRELGLCDIEQYCTHLAQQPQECRRLADYLTTNETYFFREPVHFTHLAGQVRTSPSPGSPDKPFRVWSAACSTGEEAWSLAMVLAERLGNQPWEVVATDLSERALARASAGVYRLQRLEHMPEELLRRYCRRGVNGQDGQFRIGEALRQRVRFQRHNLLDDPTNLPEFDAVFLRNVLIYFEPEVKQRVVRSVVSRLRPGGWLYTGHTDLLSEETLPIHSVQTSIFRHQPPASRK